MRTMNKAEQRALCALWKRTASQHRQPYRHFRRTASYSALCGCWFVRFAGMVVGIERDGYTHT